MFDFHTAKEILGSYGYTEENEFGEPYGTPEPEAKESRFVTCPCCKGDGLDHPRPEIFEIVNDDVCRFCDGNGLVER